MGCTDGDCCTVERGNRAMGSTLAAVVVAIVVVVVVVVVAAVSRPTVCLLVVSSLTIMFPLSITLLLE